jgi:hypothetical protein
MRFLDSEALGQTVTESMEHAGLTTADHDSSRVGAEYSESTYYLESTWHGLANIANKADRLHPLVSFTQAGNQQPPPVYREDPGQPSESRTRREPPPERQAPTRNETPPSCG